MALPRIWVHGTYGLAFLLTFGSTIPMNGQEGQPVRSDTVPPKSRWDARLCLSAARAALERGDLDGAETWALQAENAPLRFLDWVKSRWSDNSVKLWRDIQAARIQETTSQMEEIARQELMKRKETQEPGLLSAAGEKVVIKVAAVNQKVAGAPRFAPEPKNSRPESSWNKNDIDRLVSYLQKNVHSYLQKAVAPNPQATSEELLVLACSHFLQGNFQSAKTLGLRARAMDETKVILMPRDAPKNVAVAESKTAPIILAVEKNDPPTIPAQASFVNEEESEPEAQPAKSSPFWGLSNGWFLGIGLGTGVILVLFLRVRFRSPG